jgi:predicted nucleic acid-binding protein
MIIVFNTSPLIFLTRLKMLEPFLSEANKFYVPDAVPNEISAKRDQTSRSLQTLFISEQIEIQPINSFTLANSLNQRLGRGESETITLALELNADFVILDDSAARREASRLGLKVKGTLAIIKKLQQDQKIVINSTDEFYQDLVDIGFRVKRSLFDAIFTGNGA